MAALGIDWKIIVTQIIAFVVLFFLLKKFLFGPITEMFEKRQKEIAEGLKNAEEADKKLKIAKDEAEKITGNAYAEANVILKDAKSVANSESAEIVKKASDSADRIMKNAKEEATAEKDKVMLEAKKEISDVVIIALDKIVTDELTPEQKNNLTSRAINEL